MKNINISVLIPKELKEKIKELQKKDERSLCYVVRKSVENFLKEKDNKLSNFSDNEIINECEKRFLLVGSLYSKEGVIENFLKNSDYSKEQIDNFDFEDFQATYEDNEAIIEEANFTLAEILDNYLKDKTNK